ncbi:hypothetical protein L208DRAFT_1332348 [Tricholoma matsutake]|nr:hypothetical protein L208DRAFT_1332348 [Tricholoma matsutake 945]
MVEKSENRKVCLSKYMPPLIFDSTMENTRSFISSIVLYIHGRRPEFCTAKSRIMFALIHSGGGAQFWRNDAINQIAVGNKPFVTFKEILGRLEAQFGDPNPKVTANSKLKTMCQGSLMADEFILQFKVEALQMDMGEATLVEFSKARLNPSSFFIFISLFIVNFMTSQGTPYYGPYILEYLLGPIALTLPQSLLLRWHAPGNCSP